MTEQQKNSRTPEQEALLREVAKRRVRQALHQIQEAQNMLAAAASTLSSLTGAVPEWRATSKLHDRVKDHWYKVEGLAYRPVGLDSLNADAVLSAQQRAEADAA